MKKRKLKGDHIYIVERSIAEMEALRDAEEIPELREAYSEMLTGMKKEPKKSYWYCDWAVYHKDGTLVGGIGFKGPPDKDGLVEIGYGISEEYQRHGYGSEAVKLMARWAMFQWGVKGVWAQTEPDNAASQGLLLKCGFAPDGEAEEGPRYSYTGEGSTNWVPIFMCIGISVGSAIGSARGNTGLGMSMGLCIGLLWGAVLTNMQHGKGKKK